MVRKSCFTSHPGCGWGWFTLILGILVVALGFCALLGQTWTRWAGIIAAIISGIGSFWFLPFSPLWALLVIAVDVVIIWALVTARRPQTTRSARQPDDEPGMGRECPA